MISGRGVVSPIGHTPDEFHENLVSGKSGVKSLSELFPDTFDSYPTTIAAKIIDFDAGQYLELKQARRLDPVHAYAIVAAKKALQDAGLYGEQLSEFDLTRFGVIAGSAMGGCAWLFAETALSRPSRWIGPRASKGCELNAWTDALPAISPPAFRTPRFSMFGFLLRRQPG